MGLVDVLIMLHNMIEEEDCDPEKLKEVHEFLITLRDSIDDFVKKLLDSGVVKEVTIGGLIDLSESPHELHHEWRGNTVEVTPGNNNLLAEDLGAVFTRDKISSAKLKLVNGVEIRL